MMTVQHCQEALSLAFVGAVAGHAGQNLTLKKLFDYGVDGTFHQMGIRGARRVETGFSLDFQAKASVDWIRENDNIVYDLEAQAYNDMADRATRGRAMPLILILLCLAPTQPEWLEVTDDNLILRRCAYWQIISGPLTNNTATRRIRIPVQNRFTSDCLIDLLKRVETGNLI